MTFELPDPETNTEEGLLNGAVMVLEPDEPEGYLVDTEDQIPQTREDLLSRLAEPFVPRVLDAFEKLALQLKEKAREYGSIISDETSARIPTIVLWRYINDIRQDEDLARILAYFVSFSREMDSNKVATEDGWQSMKALVKDFLQSKKDELGKVLFVTEYVESGQTLMEAMSIFDEVGIEYDVAVLSRDGRFSLTTGFEKLLGEGRLLIGNKISFGSEFYGRGRVSKERQGVKKHDKPRINNRYFAPHPKKIHIEDRSNLIRARQDAFAVADWLYERSKEEPE